MKLLRCIHVDGLHIVALLSTCCNTSMFLAVQLGLSRGLVSLVLLAANTPQVSENSSTHILTWSPPLIIPSNCPRHSSRVCRVSTSLRRYISSTDSVTSVITPSIPTLTCMYRPCPVCNFSSSAHKRRQHFVMFPCLKKFAKEH